MKKILGISLVAVLAVSPMMAKAVAVDGDPGATVTTGAVSATNAPKYALKESTANDGKLATAGYVKGAYNAAIKAVNKLDDTKQDALSSDQLAAANSGITAAKVSQYDGYADTIAGKQNALTAGNGVAISGDTISADLTDKGGLELTGDTDGSKKIAVKVDDSTITKDTTSGALKVATGSIGTTQLADGVVTSLGKADSAVQTVEEGTANGTIKVDGTAVSVHGLGSAAYTASTDYDAAGTAAAAVDALDNTASQTAAAGNGQLALSVTQTNGVITAISGSIAANTYDTYGAATTAANGVKSDIEGKLDDGASGYDIDAKSLKVGGKGVATQAGVANTINGMSFTSTFTGNSIQTVTDWSTEALGSATVSGSVSTSIDGTVTYAEPSA